ncbi:uncharacterized protein M421DRAFT_349127 [Didymella exigua CBS 183.55]|uniref:KN homeodomain domain-containing protein n=1 Tax=Didymella exigua CBS 183.55 TaxID=1150837 RepID=A0A6A5RAF7_9PLEO|nr:uncharacterized protein M421DRAFT_349127 [Didymella exigua CBS 183.55]KAF1922797.1 hypothetical protein M421DRAFT_349127 [Didymella exigua CBS 183.55]
MEYLTLHDIPQRHCNPVHSHRMASQSDERPAAHMVAVCDIFSFDCTSTPGTVRLFLPPHTHRASYVFASRRRETAAQARTLPTREIVLPELSSVSPPTPPYLPGTFPSHTFLEVEMEKNKPGPDCTPDPTIAAALKCSDAVHDEYVDWCNTKTASQNHLQRSSPPLQPGEQNFPGKLPSFDEFVQTTIERTPPRTPSRRNESTENSPHVRPQFDDVTWSDSKRRRVDTLGDIYARPSNAAEYPPAESRRVSSAIDPALYHTGPARARQQSAGPSHHRPSLPYPPPASAPQHARHQSQPVAQGHVPYQQPHMQAHRVVVQGSYAQPPQPGMMYDRRQSYYQDPHIQHHAYPYDDRRESVYYANPQYAAQPTAGYESGVYYDVRFQQHVGVDHNAFNRKRRGNLPKEATNVLKDWFAANRQSPYPTEDQKLELCRVTSLSLNQVSLSPVASRVS